MILNLKRKYHICRIYWLLNRLADLSEGPYSQRVKLNLNTKYLMHQDRLKALDTAAADAG